MLTGIQLCAACHLHVTCILLGKTCIITVRYMLLVCYMQGKDACMNMRISCAYPAHVGENRTNYMYEDVATSELIIFNSYILCMGTVCN